MTARRPHLFLTLALAASLAVPASLAAAQYRHVLDDSPLDVPTEGENLSEAVKEFHKTGENPYVGDSEAESAGETIYKRQCAACHMPDGSGRIGPSLIDDQWGYERTEKMKGRFEIVYGGGAGAMQSFANRLSQDEILQVLAYVERLRDDAD